jgi:hypothetical protein
LAKNEQLRIEKERKTMSRFFVTYLGGNPPATQEEGKAHFARYQAWLAELGDAVESAMNPIRSTQVITRSGVDPIQEAVGMSGFTILIADSISQAAEMCRHCPFLEIGGTLEVSELVEMG